jgi:hypothetical protein
MADAALAVTQEGGLFYLPEDTTMQHKDSTVQKRTFFKKFLDYFNDANKDKNHKKFDFSIIGGPHYSTDTKLGLGLVAAGLYRTDRNDMLLPPSNVSLFGDVSTVGFYMLGIRGTHIFPQDKYRLDYTLYFYSFPSKFWAIRATTVNRLTNWPSKKATREPKRSGWPRSMAAMATMATTVSRLMSLP